MQIENHVPSLETCKRMKELGWSPRTTCFDWFEVEAYPGDTSGGRNFVGESFLKFYGKDNDKYRFAAPLLSEILEALPTYYPKDDTYFLVLSKNSGWTVEYACRGGDSLVYCEHESSVEAAALLWCKLVEEGIISSNEKE